MIVSWLKKRCPQPLKKLLRNPYWLIKVLRYKTVERLFPSDMVYYCPCCGLKFSRLIEGDFRNHPDNYNIKKYEHIRQDVICPACYSLPRHRILASWCVKNLVSLKEKRILYFSLETGMRHWFERNKILIISADLFNPADLKLDLMNIDQPDNCWDLVFCNHVLEHVKDYRKALKELKRILVPGGKLICSFPIDKNLKTVYEDKSLIDDMSVEADRERICSFGQKDHLRVFGLDSKNLLQEAGFLVTVIDGDTMPKDICPIVGPADYDSNKLFVCEKPVV